MDSVAFARNGKPSEDVTFERRNTVPNNLLEAEPSRTFKLHHIAEVAEYSAICRPSPIDTISHFRL
jgi:hypothetical protein